MENEAPCSSKIPACAEAWVEREKQESRASESGVSAENPNARFDVIGLITARASYGGER